MEEYRRLKEKGKEHLSQGNSEKAVEYYTRALNESRRLLETFPQNYSPSFASNEIRITCANLPEHDGKTCKYCSKFLELAVCYSNRAFAHCNLKAYEAAILDAEEAIRLAPEWPKVEII
jgi:tetratricopeptide (TPR) repeat protein